jgi:hypothetical protein
VTCAYRPGMTNSHDDTRPTSAPDTDADALAKSDALAKPDEVDPETGTDDNDVPIDNPAG